MSVKVFTEIVAGSIAVEKTALTVEPAATPVAVSAGICPLTVGPAGATVTKLHRAAPASGVPSTPCIEVATTAT